MQRLFVYIQHCQSLFKCATGSGLRRLRHFKGISSILWVYFSTLQNFLMLPKCTVSQWAKLYTGLSTLYVNVYLLISLLLNILNVS